MTDKIRLVRYNKPGATNEERLIAYFNRKKLYYLERWLNNVDEAFKTGMQEENQWEENFRTHLEKNFPNSLKYLLHRLQNEVIAW